MNKNRHREIPCPRKDPTCRHRSRVERKTWFPSDLLMRTIRKVLWQCLEALASPISLFLALRDCSKKKPLPHELSE
jgi:hypothetical protein